MKILQQRQLKFSASRARRVKLSRPIGKERAACMVTDQQAMRSSMYTNKRETNVVAACRNGQFPWSGTIAKFSNLYLIRGDFISV